jgi:rare lipoprotein A (peptidoglycan hydrolase)
MRVFRRPIHAGFVWFALAAMFVAGCGHHAARVNAPIAPARIGSTETGVASWYGIPYDGRRAASGEVYDMRQLTAAHRRLPFQTWVEVTNLSNGKQVDVRINDRGPFVKGRIVDLSQAAARDIDMLRAGIARVRLKVIPPPSIVPPASPPNIPPSMPPREPLREPPREPVEITAAPAVVPAAAATPATEQPLADAAPLVTASPLTTTAPAAEPTAMTPATITSPVTSAPATTTHVIGPPPLVASATAGRAPGFAVQAGAFSDPARAESLRAVLADHFVEARVAPSNGRTPPLWRVMVGRDMTREQAAELAIRVRRESGTAIVVLEPESAPAPNH